MSNNPFDRNKTKEARLGELITEPGEQNQRDAVHIAVVPVIAGEKLVPGQHVGIFAGGKYAHSAYEPKVGIVDPFLRQHLQPGQTFWLFLYQGQVTTLRHEWTHPAFPAVDKADPVPPSQKAVSESWLRQYAARTSPYMTAEAAYERLIDGLKEKEIHYSGSDLHSRSELIDEAELKYHAEIVLGREIDFGDESFSFTCGC